MSTWITAWIRAAMICLVLACSGRGDLSHPASKSNASLLHDVWTTENGLPQNSVTSIIQTRDGYLWLGTFGGLVRFDGVKFTVFDTGNSQGLGGNRIIRLYEDRSGNLWIALEQSGLARYSQGKFTTFTKNDGLPTSAVVRMAEDKEGKFWVTTALGIARLSEGRFVTEETLFGLPNKDTFYYLQSRDGSVWLGPQNGLVRYQAGTSTRYPFRPPFICETKDGSVWAFDQDRGLARFEAGSWITYPINDDLPGHGGRVIQAFVGRDDTICLLTSDGLTRFKDGKRVSSQPIVGLPGLISVLEDREGNLWIGSEREGLHRFKNVPITAYAAEEGLADASFVPITEDGKGGLWLGATKLFHFAAGVFSIEIQPAAVWALQRDREGSLWIGDYGKLRKLKDGRITEYPLFSGTPVVSLFESRDGSLWIGTLSGHVSGSLGGLYCFKDGEFTPYRTSEGLVHNNVRHITEDRSGALWIGTEGGLSKFQNGRFTNYTTQQGLSHNYVREIYEDADGTLWIGTYGGGLNRFKDGRFTNITTKQGLYDNVVSRILEDDRGNFWMSSNRGIYRASRKELNDFADGRAGSINCVSYGVADGMKTNECNGGGQPAGWKDRDGKLWFPTIRGVVAVDPNQINPLSPPVAVEQVLIDQQPADVWQSVAAPPGKGDLEIHYTGLSFVAPEKVRFKYRLDGYDEGWVDVGPRRVAYYTNLPPGNYMFRVIACNNDGVWNETGAVFRFRLRPHFYQTKVFYGLALAALVGLAFLGYQRHTKKLRRKHAEQQAFSRQLIESQEGERKRIAAELHDSLGQSLIIIRNRALLSLNKPGDHERAMEQLEEISAAAAHAIAEVKEISYNLRPYQLDRLGLTRALESMIRGATESSGVRFRVEIDPFDGLLSKEGEINVYRIVQEGVNNIIKHSEATEASVAVKRGAGHLQIAIEDNGKGFTAAAADADGTRKRGFGLTGMVERARMLGAHHTIRSAPGRGTTIIIKIAIREIKDGGKR
jgi:signal transduction histidine kinase/ligand-binding sensor domain-containing protein